MVGIDPKVSCHHLNINPTYTLHRQKRRTLNQVMYKALKKEVKNLSRNGFTRETIYPKWISNLILVKKPSGKQRMCRFLQPESNLPKGQLSTFKDRSTSGLYRRTQATELLRCIFGLQSDHDISDRQGMLTNFSLKQIFQKPNTSGHLIKLANKPSKFDLSFKPQVLSRVRPLLILWWNLLELWKWMR